MESDKFQAVGTGDLSFCGALKCSLGLVGEQQIAQVHCNFIVKNVLKYLIVSCKSL